MNKKSFLLALLLGLMLALTSCEGGSQPEQGRTSSDTPPPNAIEISIIYAPESHDYMPKIIADFNDAYRRNLNPLTGQTLPAGERPIFVRGQSGSSGTIMQGIVNALLVPNSENVQRPTIFQPSVSHWLALANFQARREVFNLSEALPTANAPVVMAIWESRLNAIKRTLGVDQIGWEELLKVIDAPNGWQDFGLTDARRTVFYGHTDPFVSSTGLSSLIATYYAAARETGFTGRRLTASVVADEGVRDNVRRIESLIRHYSTRTTEFKNYIAQGPDYLDFVALEENDLIAINRGLTDYQPPEKLVALYLKEGTFWHEHPMGIVNASWTTPEQREAARVFVDYVRLPSQQQYIMTFGFRPVIPEVALGFPFEEQYGVDPNAFINVLDVPEPSVVADIQNSWSFVKKQADILILIDVSGSMAQENKLEQAKQAAQIFLDRMETTNRVGLAVFSDAFRVVVPIDNLETNIVQLKNAVSRLVPEGGTALYDAMVESVNLMNAIDGENRIRAVILLSDGEDTQSKRHTLSDVEAVISASRNELNPVLVVPVGYGTLNDTLIRVLQRIASASKTTWQSGDPNNIGRVLELIGSFF
jgi:Ca-activated chloride channel family protein